MSFSMRKTAALFLALGLLAACGDDEPASYSNDVSIDPTITRGAVIGLVEDLVGRPIVGATVRVPVGEGMRSATTDDEGRFAIDGLPGGSVVDVRIEAEGFVRAHTTAYIPNTAGETPIDGGFANLGTVVLFENDGRVEFELIASDGSSLVPPSGSCVVAGSWSFRHELGWLRGPFAVPARAEGGRMICEGLPSLVALAGFAQRIHYQFEPIDVDGDGYVDYGGVSGAVDAEEFLLGGTSAVHLYPMPRAGIGLRVASSNAPHFVGEPVASRPVPADWGVEVVFSGPVTVWDAQITALDGTQRLKLEIRSEGDRVRLVPVGGAWPQGQLFLVHLLVSPLGAPLAAEDFEGVILTSASELPSVAATFEDSNDDGRLNAGETIVFQFSQVLHDIFESWNVPFQVDFDLDGSGTVGDASGEYGAGVAFTASVVGPRVYQTLADRYAYVWDRGDVDAGTEFVIRFDRRLGFGSASTPLLSEEMVVELQAIRP
jgi:hypothetical protein